MDHQDESVVVRSEAAHASPIEQKQLRKEITVAAAKVTKPAVAPQQDIRLEFPEEDYRNVAGNVSRRQDRTVRAEPPPSNRSQPALLSRKPRLFRPNDRKKNRHGDSDGDSEESGSDRKGRRDSPSARHRGRIPSDEPSHPSAEALEREEKERLELRKKLQDISERWKDIEADRSQCASERNHIIPALVQHYYEKEQSMYKKLLDSLEGVLEQERNRALENYKLEFLDDSPAIHAIRKEIDDQESSFRKYLNDSLYLDIEEKLSDENNTNELPDYRERILKRVEIGVISQCRTLDMWSRSWGAIPPSSEIRLCAIFKAMRASIWEIVNKKNILAIDIPAKTLELVRTRCPTPDMLSTTGILINAYMTKMAKSLTDAILKDLQIGGNGQDPKNLLISQIVENSRPFGNLTAEYMDWFYSGLDQHVVQRACEKWHEDTKENVIEQFRQVMDQAKMSISQEIIPDVERPGVMLLVLFKGNFPSTIKEISAEDLRRIGFKRTPEGRYWYYRVYNEYSRGNTGRETILKVDINGEVLAMMAPNGECIDRGSIKDESCM